MEEPYTPDSRPLGALFLYAVLHVQNNDPSNKRIKTHFDWMRGESEIIYFHPTPASRFAAY